MPVSLCCGCDDDDSAAPVSKQILGTSGDAAFLDTSEDLVGARYHRSPPAILRGIHGPAAGCAVRLDADVWQPQRWKLDEHLSPIDESQSHDVPGLLLTCVNGSFYAAGANAASAVWLHMHSSCGGPGAIPLVVGDEFFAAGLRLVVEDAPYAEDARSDEDGDASEAAAAAAAGGESSSDEEDAENSARRLLRHTLRQGGMSLRRSIAQVGKRLRFAAETAVFAAPVAGRTRAQLGFSALGRAERGELHGEKLAAHEVRMSGRLSYDFRRRLLDADDTGPDGRAELAQLHLRVRSDSPRLSKGPVGLGASLGGDGLGAADRLACGDGSGLDTLGSTGGASSAGPVRPTAAGGVTRALGASSCVSRDGLRRGGAAAAAAEPRSNGATAWWGRASA